MSVYTRISVKVRTGNNKQQTTNQNMANRGKELADHATSQIDSFVNNLKERVVLKQWNRFTRTNDQGLEGSASETQVLKKTHLNVI